MLQLTARALAERLADTSRPAPVLLDVREPWEVQTCTIPGSTWIPMQEIPTRLGELDPGAEVVCLCHHGMRSAQVCLFLSTQGFSNVANLQGGVDAWARQVDLNMPVY